MPGDIIIPAQVRAARALLDWSQSELAEAANVGVTTVRDIESERRPTGTGAMRELRRAFTNAGVIFVSGASDGGPGVRLVSGRPHLIRQPTFRRGWGLSFSVEWQGREITVLVSYEVIQWFGEFSGRQPESAYQKVFADHRGKILDAAARALAAGRIDPDEQVKLATEDFPGFVPVASVSAWAPHSG